jgi:etoposide-induced 2.4 mRNA
MMAMHASPLPLDPYNIVPTQRDNDPSSDTAATLRHPSPFVPIRIPVFALVIWLDDWIVRIFSVGTAGGAQHGTIQRARAFSDSSEHIEQGDGEHVQMRSLGSAAAPVPPGVTRHQIPRPRRKLD